MSHLNVPFKNQLDEPNLDGIPDINADENCLPTCLASGLQFLTGHTFTGEEIEHKVYGNNYRGGTSAVEYVQYVAQQGVSLTSRNGSPGYLVDQIVFWLGQGCPVVGTIPSTYAPPKDPMNPGSSHCILFYEDGPDNLVAMNPWRAFAQGYTKTYWESILCYGQVWVMQRKANPLNVPYGWKLSPDHSSLIAPNGHHLEHGFKDFVLAHDWDAADVPQELAEHGDGAGGTTILMSSCRLKWNPKQGVYKEYIGSELLDAQSQLIKAGQQEQLLQNQLTQAISQVEAQKTQAPLPSDLIKQLNQLDQTISSSADQIGTLLDGLQKGN